MKKEYINEVAWGKILTFFSGIEGICNKANRFLAGIAYDFD